ncbi:MoaD/ThiS family protein [SAR202 cluster bacterium AC-647-N09_OGT_505m]|nr:MoaD/ThiS family protein [SAR202 cluster bacterium AC-647-N09_OGT_505m]
MTQHTTSIGGNVAGEVERKIHIEVYGWLTSYLGGNGGGRKHFEVDFSLGETLREAVFGLSQGYPTLHQRLWNPQNGQVGPNIDFLLNDAYLGITRSLDSEVQDGDRLTIQERSS